MFTCICSPNVSEEVALADFAYSFSPLVEETALDCVVLDVSGCELRFGSAYELANVIATYATRSKAEGGLGRQINVCLAGNPDTAILAAKSFKGITFIAPGEELIALGDLPIDRLLSPTSNVQGPKSGPFNSSLKTPNSGLNKQTLDFGLWTLDTKRAEEILETLRLWGVRTFRDFARLPTTGVAERLGQEGIRLQQLASGKTERHLQLKQLPPIFNNQIELEYPVAELEPLSFIFARLLNQLCARLLAYALATNELRIHLKLEDGTIHERTLCLPVPLRDHKTFLKLLLLDTESHPPQQAVVAVAIACEPVKPQVLQSGLFIPQAPEPAKLELTLARLAKLLGSGKVGSPQVVDTHRPDTFQIKRFVVSADRKTRRRGKRETRRRGDAVTGGRGDAGTGGRGDEVTGGHGDGEKGGRGDGERGGQENWEQGRQADAVKGKQKETEIELSTSGSPVHRVSVSPHLPITSSPHPITSSPPLPIYLSPQLPITPSPRLGFRMFRPPLRALVNASQGYPQQISAWGPNRSVYGKVVRLAGPWRKTGDWWRDDGWARDEWDVAVEQSGSSATDRARVSQILYRIYQELRSGAWFVEGSYD